jgi:hypothetical protein
MKPDFRLTRNTSGGYTLEVFTAKGRDYIARTRTWLLVPEHPTLIAGLQLNRDQAMRLIVDCYFDSLNIEYVRAEIGALHPGEENKLVD